MGRYVLVYLPSKEVDEYVSKLVGEVGPKFGENYMIEQPRPVHATLKSPFFMDNPEKLEKAIEEFAKKQKQAKISVKGFGDFRRYVAFLNTDFSKEALQIQRDILEEIKVFPEVVLGEHDVEFHPHLTISYGNSKESFDGIWDYLQSLPVPKYEMKLDNLSLLKKVGGLWEVYRRFEIGGGKNE
jgi:2'-5' RNA ligase